MATVSITINPVNDNSPVFSSSATALLDENTTSVVTLQATDADLPGQNVTFAVTGGVDSARFHIVGGNRLEFVVGPDYDAPSDLNSDNVYEIQVTADDGYGLSTVQALVVTVCDVDEYDVGPVTDVDPATNAVDENAAVGTAVGITASATDADATTNAITYSLRATTADGSRSTRTAASSASPGPSTGKRTARVATSPCGRLRRTVRTPIRSSRSRCATWTSTTWERSRMWILPPTR